MTTIEAAIADACVRFQSEELPEEVWNAAKLVVKDWLACAIAGADTTAAKTITIALAPEFGGGNAQVMTGQQSASPRLAALINGTTSHALELDDIYTPALYHPGVCVIPAALAVAQHTQATSSHFLRAVIAGYEISNRLGAAVNPSHYKFWHTTGTVGTLGASIASCVVSKLSKEQCISALGHAASMSAGLQQAFKSDGMTKPLHAGRAAEAGVLSTILAQAGFLGCDEMISGPLGFGAAMSDGPSFDDIMNDLFHDFTITRPTFKRFSTCGHTFAAMDSVLELQTAMPISPRDVDHLAVETYSKAVEVAGIECPRSIFEAKFSIPFCVAATLCGHKLSSDALITKALSDPAVSALVGRVTVQGSKSFDEPFPRLRGASVEITMKDGAVQKHVTPTRKGAPENPLSDEDLMMKFGTLIESSTNSPSRHELEQWCDQLDQPHHLPPLQLVATLTEPTGRIHE